MGEINTRGMIRAKISSFPSGNDTECLSKTEVLATNTAVINGSYGNTECPAIEDIIANVITYDYSLDITPTYKLWGANDSYKGIDIKVTSKKNTYVNGVLSKSEDASFSFEWTSGNTDKFYASSDYSSGIINVYPKYNNYDTYYRYATLTIRNRLDSSVTAKFSANQATSM